MIDGKWSDKAMESAEKRRCPKCGRKSALRKRDGKIVCRWCDYERDDR